MAKLRSGKPMEEWLTEQLLMDFREGKALYHEVMEGQAVGHSDDPNIPPNELRIYTPGPEGEEPCFKIRITPTETLVPAATLEPDSVSTHPDDQQGFYRELVQRWKAIDRVCTEKKISPLGELMDRGFVDWLDDRLRLMEGPEPE